MNTSADDNCSHCRISFKSVIPLLPLISESVSTSLYGLSESAASLSSRHAFSALLAASTFSKPILANISVMVSLISWISSTTNTLVSTVLDIESFWFSICSFNLLYMDTKTMSSESLSGSFELLFDSCSFRNFFNFLLIIRLHSVASFIVNIAFTYGCCSH